MSRTEHLRLPFFEAEHRDFADDIDEWAQQATAEIEGGHAGHGDVDALCKRWVRALGGGGWLRYCVPKSHGGMHDPLRSLYLVIARETLARYSGLADFAFTMEGLGSAPITLAASEELKARYLPKVAAGEAISAFALTEPEAGSDVAAMALSARRADGAYILDGEKTFISNGGIADFYVVFARTGEAEGSRGISAFIVDAGTPGLRIAERIDVIAPHPLARIRFDRARVAAAAMIGAAGEGFKIAMATLDIFRSTVGAAALGFARRALDETIKRARMRELFGGPLADLQMVQAAIAEMALDVDAAALLVYRAAWTKDSGAARVTREAAMAKLYATESAQHVIDKAVQLHGGDGVRRGHIVERLYREIRALRIYEGASEVQKLVIARQTLSGA